MLCDVSDRGNLMDPSRGRRPAGIKTGILENMALTTLDILFQPPCHKSYSSSTDSKYHPTQNTMKALQEQYAGGIATFFLKLNIKY